MELNNYVVTVYWKNEKTSEITVKGNQVSFVNYDTDPIKLPFGVKKSATIDDLEDFYTDRCFPEYRENANELLRELDVPFYDAELICRKTHGMDNDDYMWLQFSDEVQVKYEDIKFRD